MDLLTLFARLTLDKSEYEKGLEDAEKNASGFGDKLKTGLATAAKIGTAAIGAATAAAGALVKSSVEGYANFEQLAGGVETLFGDSAAKVMENANAAFKTAGMSMNEYMETSIQSAASLINSLDGDQAKAADLMNMSITDMADNVNKMGTTMEAVQNAYRGFSRGNFTMLDNLALGFAGTKEGMEELLKKAEEVSGVKYDISSYADIVEAIHVVQEEMGITGTTAKEASETISGSLASAKSAWQNLVVGIADDNADFDTLIGNFVNSVSTAAGNIMPRVEKALQGVGKLVSGLVPVIVKEIPGLIQNTLPSLLGAAAELIKAVGGALIDNLPMILDAGIELVFTLVDGIVEALPDLIPAVVDVILTITEKLTDPDAVMRLIDAAFRIIGAIAEGLIKAIPQLVKKVPEIVKNLYDSFQRMNQQFIESGAQVIVKILEGIGNMIGPLVKEGAEVVGKFIESVKAVFYKLVGLGAEIISGVWEGIQSKAKEFKDKVTGFFTGIVDGVKKVLGIRSPSRVFREQIGQNIALGVAEGIDDKSDKAVKAADQLAKDVYSRSKDWADKQTKYQQYSLSEQIELWEAIQSQFIEGSKQYSDAEEKLFELREKQQKESFEHSKTWIDRQTKYFNLSIDDQIAAWERVIARYQRGTSEYKEAEDNLYRLRAERLEQQEKQEKQFRDSIEQIYQTIDSLESEYAQKLADRAQSIFNSYRLFDEVPERQEVNGQKLIDNLQGQISTIESFYSGLEELAERGVGSELVEDIRAMGPGALDQLTALLNLSDSKLGEYAALYGEKQELANRIAESELTDLRAITDEKIQENVDSMAEIFNSAVESSEGWGAGLIENFISGIQSMEGALSEAVRNVTQRVAGFFGFSGAQPFDFNPAPGFASGLGQGNIASAPAPNVATNVEINYTGSLAQIARLMRPEIIIENKRVGEAIVVGA